MELARGSHKWNLCAPDGEFHGPWVVRRPCAEPRQKRTKTLRSFRLLCVQVEARFITAERGMGQGLNTPDRPRRSLVVHAIPANVKFVREKIAIGNGPVYGRYMKLRDNSLDENYFPILWTATGGRRPRPR